MASQFKTVLAKTGVDTRKAQGMTQNELGRRAKVNQARVSQLESATRDCTLETAERVLAALNLRLRIEPNSSVKSATHPTDQAIGEDFDALFSPPLPTEPPQRRDSA